MHLDLAQAINPKIGRLPFLASLIATALPTTKGGGVAAVQFHAGHVQEKPITVQNDAPHLLPFTISRPFAEMPIHSFYHATPSLWRKMRQGPYAIGSLFSTCREYIKWLPPDRLLRHTHVLPQTNAAEFQILLYLCPVLRTWEECLSWFSSTKIINSSQFIEKLKVKTTSMSDYRKYCILA